MPGGLRQVQRDALRSTTKLVYEGSVTQSDGLREGRDGVDEFERELIVRALEKTQGNVTHTARLLKISRKSLQTKMKELGLREDG